MHMRCGKINTSIWIDLNPRAARIVKVDGWRCRFPTSAITVTLCAIAVECNLVSYGRSLNIFKDLVRNQSKKSRAEVLKVENHVKCASFGTGVHIHVQKWAEQQSTVRQWWAMQCREMHATTPHPAEKTGRLQVCCWRCDTVSHEMQSTVRRKLLHVQRIQRLAVPGPP